MKRKVEPVELSEDRLELIYNVKHCAREMCDILQGARRKCEKNSLAFAKNNITMLFRASDCYTVMYRKLGSSSRDTLNKLLKKDAHIDEMQDAFDDLVETEELWRNFLNNLDMDLNITNQSSGRANTVGQSISPEKLSFFDMIVNQNIALDQVLSSCRLMVFICIPVYLPPVIANWFIELMLKKYASDFQLFKMRFTLILWGNQSTSFTNEDEVDRLDKSTKDLLAASSQYTFQPKRCHNYTDARDWLKLAKLKVISQKERRTTTEQDAEVKGFSYVLWDSNSYISNNKALLNCQAGLSKLWCAENMQFYGQQKCENRGVHPPPLNVDWTCCTRLGGCVVLSHKGKLKLQHASEFVYDLPSVDDIYQLGLRSYVKAVNQSEAEVRFTLHKRRVYHISPDIRRFKWEPAHAMYVDPETEFLYDINSQYYYDGVLGEYLYWDEKEETYKSAQERYDEALRHYEEEKQKNCERLRACEMAISQVKEHIEKEKNLLEAKEREQQLWNCLAEEENRRREVAGSFFEGLDAWSIYSSSTNGVADPTGTADGKDFLLSRPIAHRVFNSMEDDLKPPGT